MWEVTQRRFIRRRKSHKPVNTTVHHSSDTSAAASASTTESDRGYASLHSQTLAGAHHYEEINHNTTASFGYGANRNRPDQAESRPDYIELDLDSTSNANVPYEIPNNERNAMSLRGSSRTTVYP